MIAEIALAFLIGTIGGRLLAPRGHKSLPAPRRDSCRGIDIVGYPCKGSADDRCAGELCVEHCSKFCKCVST